MAAAGGPGGAPRLCQWQRVLRLALVTAAAMAAAGGPARAAQNTPPGNLELIIDAAALAVSDGLADLDLGAVGPPARPENGAAVAAPFSEAIPGAEAPGIAVHLATRGNHNANWVVEHALLEELLSRGIAVVADSVGPPTLSFRIVELGIVGYSGVLRSSVERRCRVSLSLQLEAGGELVWTGEASRVLTDRVEKRRIKALQSATYSFAKTEVDEQSWGKYVEPMIVSSVLGGLVYLFFSNR